MPTLKGTEASLFYVQCFLYLVSSLRNVSIFRSVWLDTFRTTLTYAIMSYGERGVVVWHLKRREAAHMEIGKHIFGKEMSAGPSLTRGHRKDFDQIGLNRFHSVYHILTSSY